MARVYTPLPSGDGHWGERIFADALTQLGDDAHLWFGVNYLAGGTDIDSLVAIEGLGVFVIEVKGVPLAEIESYGQGACKIRNRPGTKTPLQQALKAQQLLMQYLRSTAAMKRLPWFHVTASFPRIDRDEFLRAWAHPGVRAQAKGMFFGDDLGSPDRLLSVFRNVTEFPPIGGPDERRHGLTTATVESLRDAISPDDAVGPTANDVARMKVVERQLNSTRRPYIQPSGAPGRAEVLFSGRPGTGKTFRLLEIALGHARAGRNVVLACHNKVLASELRRMLLADEVSSDTGGDLDVLDVHQLLDRYPNDPMDHDNGGGFDAWAEAKVRRLARERRPDELFDTVLVDEGQDVEDWMFDLLRWCSGPDSEWFVAEGRGQALYRDTPADWLVSYRQRADAQARVHRLSRVYRNAKADFLVARCTHEISPGAGEIEQWFSAHPLVEDQLTLDFERDDFDRLGEPPSLANLPALPDELTTAEYREETVRRYADLIRDELALLERLQTPGDLAILVPKPHADQGRGGDYLARRVCDALELVGVPYIDQVDVDSRRSIRPDGVVRLVTYHSSRGVEAARVLVLGLEEVGRGMGGTLERQRNLAYVVLTRAKFGSRVVVSAARSGPHIEFVQSVVAHVRRAVESVGSAQVVATELPDRGWLAGQIVRYVSDRGFGFISAGDDEVFFHINSVFGIPEGAVRDGASVQVAREPDVGSGSPRATMVVSTVPTALDSDPQPGYEAAVVSEPIGDRGFGFLLSPRHGRVFMHRSSISEGDPESLVVGTRVDVIARPGPDGRPRASYVSIR